MTAGVRLQELDIRYMTEPALRVVDPADGKVLQTWSGREEWNAAEDWFYTAGFKLTRIRRNLYIPVEVFAEANGPYKPYTRQEFRELCDKCSNVREITALIAQTRLPGNSWLYLIVFVAAVTAFFGILRLLRHRRKPVTE